MFIFKKIISPLLMPFQASIFLLLIGIVLLWFSRKQKLGKIFITIGLSLLLVSSYSFSGTYLMKSLETQYAPLNTEKLRLFSISDKAAVKWIVVLGGGQKFDPDQPVSSYLSSSALSRLVEGIRLLSIFPNSRLILSGGKSFGVPISQAKISSEVAIALGVDKNRLFLVNEPKDTKDEALQIKDIVGKGKTILVTSAFHMKRAMALFEKQGLNPLPAPTDFTITKSYGIRPDFFFPDSGIPGILEAAIHEYLGFIWAKFRGQV